MQTIYLDISNKGVVPTVYAKQGDVGRKFQVVLTDSGVPYIPANGSAFSVWYSGASGEGNYTDIGDKSAFSVNGNKVIVEMITQMLSNDGEGILSLVLNDNGGNQIGLWSIRYVCESVPGAESEEAKQYYSAFSESVKKLSDTDAILRNKLSVDGTNTMEADLPMGGHKVTGLGEPAADGDAVPLGFANDHFTPAGYGLGGYGEEKGIASISELDNFKANGKFTISQTIGRPLVLEGIYFNSLLLEVSMLNANYGTQIVRFSDGGTIRRVCEGGAWQPWGWENPPMVEGVEYRTVERFSGKAVYAKSVNIGALPNAGRNYIYDVIPTDASVISIDGYGETSSEVQPLVTLVDEVWAQANSGYIGVITSVDRSAYSAVVIVKYTKD